MTSPARSARSRLRRVDLALVAFFLALSVLTLVESNRVALAVAESGIEEVLDPAGYLRFLGWLFLLATLCLGWICVRGDVRADAAHEAVTAKPLVPVVGMVVFALLLPAVGFAIANLVFLMIVLTASSRFSLLPALGIAIVTAGATYALFVLLLDVPFPALGRFGI